MSELVAAQPSLPVHRAPTLVALDADAPRLEDLFTFMADAELRVRSLRLRVEERTATARGEELATIELVLEHPGRARVTTHAGTEDPLSRRYRVWASDGEVVTTYDAMDERASVRPVRALPVGVADPTKPRFAQVYVPLTPLPSNSVVDTLVHPHGLIRNVLLTGPIVLLGTTHIAGRETLVLRADHPRSAHVLTDRPDRWLEVGVDRMTGFISLLVEHIGERVTRHAQVTFLEPDGPIPPESFTVHLPADVRMIY